MSHKIYFGRYCHAVVLLAVILLVGCARLSAVDIKAPVSDDRVSFDQLLNQRNGLAIRQRQQSVQLMERLHEQRVLFDHDEYGALIERVQRRIFTPSQRQKLNVYFARMPGENAFALPTGDIVVHLAMLAALQNEEQLAFVLAHEFVHVLENHAWLSAGNRKSNRIVAHLSDLLTFGSGATYRHFSQSIQHFSRQQELRADYVAAGILRRAGYNLTLASGFFDLLNQYPQTLDGPKKMRSHPSNELRKERILAEVNKNPQENLYQPDRARFDRLRIKLLQRSIRDKVDGQDFPGALVQIDDLERLLFDRRVTECLRGEVYLSLSRNEPESARAMREATGGDVNTDAGDFFLRQAALAYQEVLLMDASESCALRGMGLVLHANGQSQKSRQLLQAFLRGTPSDAERRHAEWLMAEESL